MENAKRQNFLEDPEYQTLLAWYNYTEKCLDISLDLIGMDLICIKLRLALLARSAYNSYMSIAGLCHQESSVAMSSHLVMSSFPKWLLSTLVNMYLLFCR